jgi:hypothetical protein
MEQKFSENPEIQEAEVCISIQKNIILILINSKKSEEF